MGDGDILCKKQKLVPINDNEIRSKEQITEKPIGNSPTTPPRIFSLNTDCLDEIFEYLSLKDLHSVGKTCKSFQTIAGEYFKLNYSSAEKLIGNDGIYTINSNDKGVINQRIQTSCFNQFTQFISHYYEEFEPFRYIDSHSNEFSQINHLYLVCVGLNAAKMMYFKGILPNIEILRIRQCTVWADDFYEILLKFCTKLKRLYIQDDLGDIIHRKSNPWLLKTYTQLEHLELNSRYSFEIHEIPEFFNLNANIQSFSTNSHCFWINRDKFMQTNIKLNSLEIKHFDSGFYFYHIEKSTVESICNLMNGLFERGFYKKAHFYIKEIDDTSCNELAMLKGLEKLSIQSIYGSGVRLARLVNLRELQIFDCTNATDLDEIASKLVYLERILLQNASYDDILPFVKRSARLKQLKIRPNEKSFNEGFLNLIELNKDRGKLVPMAKKLTIFIEDNIFLTTKWNTKNGDTNLKFIEMKRANSHCWR